MVDWIDPQTPLSIRSLTGMRAIMTNGLIICLYKHHQAALLPSPKFCLSIVFIAHKQESKASHSEQDYYEYFLSKWTNLFLFALLFIMRTALTN
jgi:hypothetical protein